MGLVFAVDFELDLVGVGAARFMADANIGASFFAPLFLCGVSSPPAILVNRSGEDDGPALEEDACE